MWYRHTFLVKGTDTFPVDMLRYDACFPADTADAQLILADDHEGPREIWLRTYNQQKGWAPTHSRWESMTWRVLEWETQKA